MILNLEGQASNRKIDEKQQMEAQKFLLLRFQDLQRNLMLENERLKRLTIESKDKRMETYAETNQIKAEAAEKKNRLRQMKELYKQSVSESLEAFNKKMQNMKQNRQNAQNLRIEHSQRQEILSSLRQKLKILGQQYQFKQKQREILKSQTKFRNNQLCKLDNDIERITKSVVQLELTINELFQTKKRLNNELQELKGNIRVYCRVRPGHTKESVIEITSENTLKLILNKENIKMQAQKFEQGFLFQLIFDSNSSQQSIFTQISQLIQNSIDGKNVCIFAYGQTGSGKTHTLHGPDDQHLSPAQRYHQRGLTSRSIDLIFKQIEDSSHFNWKYKAFLSIQEIYLETIIDLVTKNPIALDRQTEIEVNSPEQIEAYLKEAKLNRKISATHCNERSSRSHLIVMIRLEGKSEVTTDRRNGSLVLVDLAGSERLKQSKVEGDSLKETQFINKSLSALGNVINGLRKKSEHIPYRNSKLTHVLQKYLEGQSKTLMFVNISPDPEDGSQTKISLSFAESVRDCKMNNNANIKK